MTSPNLAGDTGPEECSADSGSHTFQYRGWRVTIELEPSNADGIVSGHADLHDRSAFRCRLMLSGRHDDGVSAIRALAAKARTLIDERHEDA
ncbi:hypothetical protein VAR608DRAFT_1587 [Variovorax sp. HW608]|uniref:hypothetical protein n=1 Tax=Variovorax sp. HW608 TaxID=1034889 RepID=UPI00081F7C6F|nr:hypothetical protein [Variovorax sp. HW608]SCK21106.1 hypothetical protein VAR608DRAFT_1587 [Variovorax sp. HW608]